MPTYRKLHTKVIESLDFDDLGDDFTRLMWVLLPLKSCAEGRGRADGRMLKANLFPLRDDVKSTDCQAGLARIAELGMVRIYQVKGVLYYQINNWHDYQGDTTREANSIYPAPPVCEPDPDPTHEPEPVILPDPAPVPPQVTSRSRVGHEQVMSRSSTDTQVDTNTQVKAKKTPPISPPGGRGRRKRRPDLELPGDLVDLLEPWQLFQKHRMEKNRVVTETEAAELFESFRDWGPERAEAALRYTIRKGWQGVELDPQFGRDPTPGGANGSAPPAPQLSEAQAALAEARRRRETAGATI